jgi:hypothetical protein
MTDCHGAKALIADEGAGIDAGRCVALGEGLANATLRVPSFISVQARTSDNRIVCEGGHAVRLRTSGPSKLTFKVQDNRDGTHFVTYVVNVTGKYFIDIFVDGKPIQGSPFTVSASSGEAAASLSKIDGLERSPEYNSVVAGEPASFQISSVDANGHPAGTGGAKWFLQVRALSALGLTLPPQTPLTPPHRPPHCRLPAAEEARQSGFNQPRIFSGHSRPRGRWRSRFRVRAKQLVLQHLGFVQRSVPGGL